MCAFSPTLPPSQLLLVLLRVERGWLTSRTAWFSNFSRVRANIGPLHEDVAGCVTVQMREEKGLQPSPQVHRVQGEGLKTALPDPLLLQTGPS